MLDKIREYIKKEHMLTEGDRIVVGVSGGADSMCLLHVLMSIQKEYKLSLFVVHVNHQIRGAEADKEEKYVQDYCIKHGIMVNCIKKDIPAMANQLGYSLEEAGRIIRYQVFEEECNLHHCNRIAVAHNRNDNAETVLFHLFRGCRMDGITGIHPISNKVIRPLLCLSRQEIEQYDKKYHIDFCTDSSNFCMDYARNRIRNEILTQAVLVNQRAVEHVAEYAEEMEMVSEFLKELANKVYQKVVTMQGEDVCLDVELLRGENPVLIQRVIQSGIDQMGKGKQDIQAVHIKKAEELLYLPTGKEIHLPHGIRIIREYQLLRITTRKTEKKSGFSSYVAPIPGELDVAEQDISFEFQLWEQGVLPAVMKNNYTKWYDYDKIKDAVVVRTRQQGDFLQIHRDGGKKSLKSLFIDYKVVKEEREKIYLVASGSHILWVPGIRTSEAFLVDENTTRILSVALKSKKGKV